jgi:hypothetical protein
LFRYNAGLGLVEPAAEPLKSGSRVQADRSFLFDLRVQYHEDTEDSLERR